MYHSDPPLRVKADELEAVDGCPASAGPGSRLPAGALDRWIAVRYALESALSNGGDVDRAVEDNAAWLDPVQREIVTDLVNNGLIMLGASDAEVLFDPDHNVVLVDLVELNVELASYIQMIVTDPNDPSTAERFKIKTGKQGTSRAEAAILLSGPNPDARFADLMLMEGTIEPIEMSTDEKDTELERLSEIAARERNVRNRKPGWQCYRCDRVARCGQYPVSAGYKVGARQRTIRVSKSDVLRLAECHRRLSWKALHVMPKEPDESSPAAATGLLFHEILATVLLTDDHDQAFAKELEGVSPADQQIMTELYERHRQIETDHVPVEYKLTEYQVGSTFILEGLDADRDGNIRDGAAVAVTIIARTDAVGRELDGTPAVIEHRTGMASDRIDERETALYAVSTARLLGVEAVAVHQHSLGASGDPQCIRILYDANRLVQAEEFLVTLLDPLVRWNPLDATQPRYSVGEWCATCPYRSRCERFRS